MPKLYSADVQLAQPVRVPGDAPAKAAPRGKARPLPTPDHTPEPHAAAAGPANGHALNGDAKPKRTLTEEQKAKMREARERKKQEKAEQERLQREHEAEQARLLEEAAAAAERKREEAKARRRANRLKRKADQQNGGPQEPASSAVSDISSVAEEVPSEPQAKHKRKARKVEQKPVGGHAADHEGPEGEAPPPWFTKFVAGFRSEKKEQEGLKTSKKDLKAEAEREARQKWNDQVTRGRIQSEVDGHLSSMYNAIFR